jgi:hypothetical protein
VRTTTLAALAAATLLLAACGGTVDGDVGSTPSSAPAPAGDADDGPGDGVDGADDGVDGGGVDGAAGACLEGTEDCVDTPGLEPSTGDDMVPPDIEVVETPLEEHRVVEPRDVVDDRFPVFLQWATEDGTTLTVGYYAGVEPCFVTAEVVVSELDDVVAVTVLGGPDREAGDVACIELAEALAVEVELSAPLDGRRLVDGSRATPEDLGA